MIRMPCLIIYVTTCEHCVASAKAGKLLAAEPEARASRSCCKISASLPAIIVNRAQLSIPVNTLVFYAVPVVYRSLALSCVSVGWMTYLSIVQHTKGGGQGWVSRKCGEEGGACPNTAGHNLESFDI